MILTPWAELVLPRTQCSRNTMLIRWKAHNLWAVLFRPEMQWPLHYGLMDLQSKSGPCWDSAPPAIGPGRHIGPPIFLEYWISDEIPWSEHSMIVWIFSAPIFFFMSIISFQSLQVSNSCRWICSCRFKGCGVKTSGQSECVHIDSGWFDVLHDLFRLIWCSPCICAPQCSPWPSSLLTDCACFAPFPAVGPVPSPMILTKAGLSPL
jgi:hypothetical protein